MSFESGKPGYQSGGWEAQGGSWPPPPSGPPLSPDPPPSPETPAPTRRRVPRALLIGSAAVGMALGGAGIAYAASSSGSSSSTTPSTTPSSGLAQHRHPGRFGFGFGLGGRVVHGEYTVQNGRGGYTTILVQTGKASSVSSSSITVTSTDGYKHNYAVVPSTVVDAQRDGIGTVGSGDQVRVIATSAAGKDTASDIVDTSKVASGNAGFGLRGGFPGPPGFGTFNRPANLPAGANPPALPAGPASS